MRGISYQHWMERTSHERDHHPNSGPEETTGQLLIGREYIGSIHSHEDRCMDLGVPLAEKSRLPHCLPDRKEQETWMASCQYRALPDLRWPRPGGTFHGITDGMGSSSSPRSSAICCYSPDFSETVLSSRRAWLDLRFSRWYRRFHRRDQSA